MKEYIKKITEGSDLSIEEAEDAMRRIFSEASDVEISAFLIALKMKGESVDEIAGMAKGMRKAAKKISPSVSPLIDTCGTGGDRYNTINVSTAAAIVVASSGIPVAKHGNYSITSKCGSADVLKELGVEIELSPEEVRESIEKIGIGFMLAPIFHPSMKRVAGIRKEIGVRTVFNILGPLTNPANADAQVIGVYDGGMCEKIANVLKELGLKRAMVVHGDGLDEISNIGETMISELKNGKISSYKIKPEDFGFRRYKPEDISGGSPEENAKDLIRILKGERGAKRDIVVLNSAAGIYIGGKAKDMEEGIEIAENTIDSGEALEKLREMVEYRYNIGHNKLN
ncbi:MAG: anthranilate phosphoribosyltransferase [Candidatus Syntropharchaeia archaeon]